MANEISFEEFNAKYAPKQQDTEISFDDFNAKYAAEPKSRSFGEVVGDVGSQLGKGVNTIAGAIPNLLDPSSPVSKFFNDNAQYWQNDQSQITKSLEAAADARIAEAAKTGQWEAFKIAVKEYGAEPALVQKLILENIPSMIPGLAAAKGAQIAAKGSVIAGTVAGAGTNSLLNAGGARQESYQDIKKTLIERGMPEAEADAQALEKSKVAAGVGAVTGALSGGSGLERGILGGAKGGFAKRAGVELGGEQLEEVAPTIATNMQLGRDAMTGVGETSAKTLIASSPGSVISGFQGNSQPVQPTPPGAAQPDIASSSNVDELISATKSSIDVELDNQTNQDLLDEISASNNATSSNAPVDQSYVPQPDTAPRPDINIAPDVQPLVDNAESLASEQAQPIIEQSQPIDLNVNLVQASQELQPTEGATNGTTSQYADSMLDSGSTASTSANPAGSNGNGVLRYDATIGTGGLGLPGTVVETDGAGGVSANGSNKPDNITPADRSQPTVNSDFTPTPSSTLPGRSTTTPASTAQAVPTTDSALSEALKPLRTEILKFKGEGKTVTGTKTIYDATDRLKAIAEDTGETSLKAQQVWFNSKRKTLEKNGDTEAAALFERIVAQLKERINTVQEPAPVKIDDQVATVASDAVKKTAEVVSSKGIKPQRTSSIEQMKDGGWRVKKYEDGLLKNTIDYDVRGKAESERVLWERGLKYEPIPLNTEFSDIDKAATAGYKAGLNGGSNQPNFGFNSDEESHAFNIGMRRGLEDSKSKPTPKPKPKRKTADTSSQDRVAESANDMFAYLKKSEGGIVHKGKILYPAIKVIGMPGVFQWRNGSVKKITDGGIGIKDASEDESNDVIDALEKDQAQIVLNSHWGGSGKDTGQQSVSVIHNPKGMEYKAKDDWINNRNGKPATSTQETKPQPESKPTETTKEKPLNEMTPADHLRAAADKMDAKSKPDVSKKVESIDTSKEPVRAIDIQSELFKRVQEGDVTADEFKASFDALLKNKDGIIAELEAMTKPEIFKRFPDIEYRYKSEKKDKGIEAAYRDMIEDFTLGQSYSYGMSSGSMIDSIRSLVEKTTDELLAEYADKIKRNREERAAKREEAKAGTENPQTLDDFNRLMQVKAQELGEGTTFAQARMELTPEQRERFDELAAAKTRSERETRKTAQQEQSMRAPGEVLETTEIIKTKHTKHGHDLWQFNLVQRVSSEEFKVLAGQAKRLGGDYSSYRGGGAIPGWQFRTEEAAKAFKSLVAGDTSQAKDIAQTRRDAYADDRSQSATERLNEMADKLDEQADESLSRGRKENTNRRAEQAARAETAARSDKALAQTMRNIASAIENGSAKMLDKVRQKVQIEALRGFVNTGNAEMQRKLYPAYVDQLKHKDDPIPKEAADYVAYPAYTAYRSDLANIGRALLEVDGTKKLGQQIMKVADDVSATYMKFAKDNADKVSTFRTKSGERAAFASKSDAEEAIARSNYRGAAIVLPVKRGENLIILSPSEAIKRGIWQGDDDKRITLHPDIGAELVEKMGKAARRGVKISVPWQLENAYDSRKRLAGMGIETPAELRAAVREFIGLREAPKEADKIKQMERAMIGRANDGLDFFPTPAGVADEMVQSADIREGMSILEPSAGMGHIADRIREAGVEPDVVELSASRRELLEAKGYNIVDHDFMDVAGKYDRIIMNPPFGDRRDAQHVQHAYNLLKPGGRVVAIVGEGVFFGNDAKAQAFRDWLEKVGGTDEKLDQGTFLDPSLPVNTGVSARMVVIDKSADAKFSKSTTTNTHTVASATSAMLEAHKGKIKSVLQAMLDTGKAKVVTAEQAAGIVGEDAMSSDAQAFYNPADKATYFVADQIPIAYTAQEFKGLVLHEIAVHAKELGKDSKEFKSILAQVDMMRKAGNKAITAAFERVPKDTSPEHVTGEALAYAVQHYRQLGIVQRVMAWFRNTIRAIGKSFPTLQKMRLNDWANNLNEKDLRFMAESALKNSERSGVQNESDTPLFSKLSQTATAAFKKWFAGSNVINEDGSPLVVYHGGTLGENIKPFAGMIWLAENKDYASSFAEQDGGSVAMLYVSIKNPLDVSNLKGEKTLSSWRKFLSNNGIDISKVKLEDWAPEYGKYTFFDLLPHAGNNYFNNRNNGLIDEIKHAGFDGIKAPEETTDGIKSGQTYVVFDSANIESATDNNILFSKNTNPVTHSFQPENSGKPLDSWIKIFTRNQIVTLYRDSLIGKKLQEYKELREQVTADTNKLFEKADNFLLELRQIPKGLRDAFASLAHDSTLNNVDPSNPKYVPSPDAVKLASYLANPTNQTLAAKIRKRLNSMEAAHKKLHAEFNALPTKEQELFKELRSKYTEQMTMVFDEFKNRIGRMKNIDPAIKASSVKKLDEQLADLLGRVYFPLYRAGNYIVKAEKAGEPTTVDHVESNFAADRLEKKLKKLGYTVSRSTRIVSPQDNKSGEALNAVRELLDKAALKGKIEGAELSQLMDDIDQTILQSLPDQSYRKSFIHRKGTKGYSDDFIRAYADAMRRGSINISNLRHGDKIATVIEDMRKDVKAASKVPGSNVAALNQVVDRVEQIEVDIRNPTSKLVSVSGKIAFAQMLGSLSNFILNITQTPLLTMPHLGAEYGYGKANLQLAMAYAKQMRSLKKQGTLSELGKWLDMRHGLVGNELDLMQQLHDSGALDLTQSFDLIDAANNPSYQENELSMNFMKVIALPQHVSEIVNRQVTALATIRLEMARSGSPLKAYHAARKAIDQTHFDYSKENRSKLMTGNTQSMLFRFKQYAQQAAFLFVHTAKLALDGSTKLDSDGNKLDGTRPSERTKARKQLAGVLGMQILVAGTLGLPVFAEAAVAASGVAGFKLAGSTGAYVGVAGAIILAAALAFGDDDGEEFDVEVKKWFIKHFGEGVGSSLADGVIPRGLASRLNASELVIRRPEEARNSTDFANQWMISLLGAFWGGTVYNAGVGLKDIVEGDTAKGATKLIPVKAIKDLVTSWQWANDGMNVTNKDGEIITPVSKADIFFKSIGINPTSVVNAREYDNAKFTLHNALLKKQQKALKELREETDKTKRFNAIIKYNKSAPLGYEIDSDKVRGVIAREIKYKGKPNVVTGNPVQEDYLNKNTKELRPAY